MNRKLTDFLAVKEQEFATLPFVQRFQELNFLQKTIEQGLSEGRDIDDLVAAYRHYNPAHAEPKNSEMPVSAELAEEKSLVDGGADSDAGIAADACVNTNLSDTAVAVDNNTVIDNNISIDNNAAVADNADSDNGTRLAEQTAAQAITFATSSDIEAGSVTAQQSTAQETERTNVPAPKPLQPTTEFTDIADADKYSAAPSTPTDTTNNESSANHDTASAPKESEPETAQAKQEKHAEQSKTKWQAWQDSRLTAYIWQLEHNCAGLPENERAWRLDAAKNAINEMLAENMSVDQILLRLPDTGTFVNNFNTANREAGIKPAKGGFFAKLGIILLTLLTFLALQLPLTIVAVSLVASSCLSLLAGFIRLSGLFIPVASVLPYGEYIKVTMPQLTNLAIYGTPLYYILEFVTIIAIACLLLLAAHLFWGIVKMLGQGLKNLWYKACGKQQL